MDKIKIIILTLALAFTSCKKEEETLIEEDVVNCHCGSYEPTHRGFSPNYFYRVTNYCTNAPLYIEVREELTGGEYCLNYQW